jgi:excisionase family DNA binding protein
MQADLHDIAIQPEHLLALLTPSEAANMLRLSKASIYRLVETRRLPFYRVSGSLRFSKKDLEDYLARGRVESVLQERR